MSDLPPPTGDAPDQPDSNDQPKKNTAVVIAVVVGLVVFLMAVCSGDDEPSEEPAARQTTAAPTTPADEPSPTEVAAECEPAPSDVVDAIASGLTVQGGGGLEDAYRVPVPPELQNDQGFPAAIIGAKITGEGMGNTVGTWAVSDNHATIIALDSLAQEFSEWGSAAQPGSRAAEVRDTIRQYDETRAASRCASD